MDGLASAWVYRLRTTWAAGIPGDDGNHTTGLGNHPGAPSPLDPAFTGSRARFTLGARSANRPGPHCRFGQDPRSRGLGSRVSAAFDGLYRTIPSGLNPFLSASPMLCRSRGPWCRSGPSSRSGCWIPLLACPGQSGLTGFRWTALPAVPRPLLDRRRCSPCPGSRQGAPTGRRPATGWETPCWNGPAGPDSRAGGLPW